MILPITLTIAGAAAILNVWLAARTVPMRLKGKVLHGDGGNPLLLRRMRAHANFIEYAPFVLILMGLIEAAHQSAPWLWYVGIVFVLARIAHAFGMDRDGPGPLRAGGILVTWAVLVGLAGYALTIPYRMPAPAPAASSVSG